MEDSDDKQEQNNLEKTSSLFRKRGNTQHIRKRTFDGEEDEETKSSIVRTTTKKSFRSDNKLFFSTGDSKNPAFSSSQPKDGQHRCSMFKFESSKDIQIQNDSRATAVLETETEFSKDARAIRERVLRQAESVLKGKGGSSLGGEKLYKGVHGYTDFKAGFRREQTVASEKAGGAHGPLRASAHIRMSARFDYQPDVCKDYKETGYCGYGDACKFLHDRGDYKSGWQLEKEWEEVEKSRRGLTFGKRGVDMVSGDENDGDEDELPFACFICREPFVDPVFTKCKHYFCEHCALKHHSKNKKCFVCNQPTLGIFNIAHEIKKKAAAACIKK